MIDPEIQKYMDRQRLQSWIQNVSQGLMQAGAGGMGLGSGLAFGVGSGGAPQEDPMHALEMQGFLEDRKRQQSQSEAFNRLWPEGPQYAGQPSPHGAPGTQYASAGGPTPAMGGPSAPPGAQSAGQLIPRDLALALGPERALEMYAKQSMEGPPERRIVQGQDGYKYYEDTGERVLPNVQARDPNLLSPEAVEQKIRVARESQTPDRQLVEVFDPTSETGTRWVPRSEAPGRAGKPGSGFELEVGADGNIRVSQGRGVTGDGGGSLGKKTQGDVEQDLRAASEGLARLSDIQSRFKREYQTVPFRWDQITSAWQEKLTGTDLSPEASAELQEYSAYRRTAVSNLNDYINEITGAQVGQGDETRRLKRGMPDPGTGLFDGDSPTEFQSKLNDTVKSLKKAAARQAYALSNNLNWQAVPLDDIENIMRTREQEISQEIRAANPEADDEMLKEELKRQLASEFGLTFQ